MAEELIQDITTVRRKKKYAVCYRTMLSAKSWEVLLLFLFFVYDLETFLLASEKCDSVR